MSSRSRVTCRSAFRHYSYHAPGRIHLSAETAPGSTTPPLAERLCSLRPTAPRIFHSAMVPSGKQEHALVRRNCPEVHGADWKWVTGEVKNRRASLSESD